MCLGSGFALDLPVHAGLPVLLVTLLLGEEAVEQKLCVLLGVVTEEGGGVDVGLALANESPCYGVTLTNQKLTWLLKDTSWLAFKPVSCP